jgi:hypothetical protein
MKKTLVYRVPSATFHHTIGDKYLFLDFVDRDNTIKYKTTTKTGKALLARMKKYGSYKVTYPK